MYARSIDVPGRNVHGKDVVVALPQPGMVGVMLNRGDGTFGALQQHFAGPACVGLAIEVELGDVTSPAGSFVQDGKLDAYVLAQVAMPLASTPGVDAVAIADVDGDRCNDVIAAGVHGTGMIHLGNGAGGFDGGRDVAQLGYQNPALATRVSMAVGDLTADGHPDVVIAA